MKGVILTLISNVFLEAYRNSFESSVCFLIMEMATDYFLAFKLSAKSYLK